LLDTNIFLIGFSDAHSAENRVLDYLMTRRQDTTLLLSDEMSDQLVRTAKRVRDKDWAGLLLFYLWRDFDVSYVDLGATWDLARAYQSKIPREDLLVFLTAMVGDADCFVSLNRKLLKAALGQHPPFECLTPEEFLAQYQATE
jgi:predicted nucleic acid-binding protein